MVNDKVYIVIINYRTFSDTIECLESVLKSDYTNFQIFVVDNSPGNESIGQLADWITNNHYTGLKTDFKRLVFPLEVKPINHTIVFEDDFNNGSEPYDKKVVIIRAKNRGFAAANNIVLNYILENGEESALIWILNNDTVVENDTLGNLAGFFHSSEDKKYIAGARLRYYNRPGVIQAVAGNYNIWLGKHTHIGEGEEDRGQYDNYKPGKRDYIVGASLFLPKLFVEQTGLMCEDYFLYFEELDWMKAGGKYGYRMALVPNAVIYHKEGASVIGKNEKKDLSVAAYYSITGRVKFIKKWYPWCLFTVMIGVIFALVKRLLQGKIGLVKKTSGAVARILFTRG